MKSIIILAILAISIALNIKYLTNKFLYKPAPPAPMVRTKAASVFNLSRGSEFDELKVDSGDIVFIGNSLTDLFELGEFFGRLDIKNRGIAGDLTSDVLRRLGPIIAGRPRQLFLEIGINDLLQSISVDSTFKNIELIVEAIKAVSPRTDIVVTSLLPTNWNRTNTDKRVLPEIAQLNEKLNEMAHAKNLHYLDLYPDYLQNDGMAKTYDCGDGLHLNGAGYLFWKKKIDPLLKTR